MSAAWHGGKGDAKRPETQAGAYGRGFDGIDWSVKRDTPAPAVSPPAVAADPVAVGNEIHRNVESVALAERARAASDRLLAWRKEMPAVWYGNAALEEAIVALTLVATALDSSGSNQHPDDAAVDRFASAMKAKLADARRKGRGGWDEPGLQQRLSDMLRDHVDKGDPRDVGAFACFLFNRGEAIAAAESGTVTVQEAWEWAGGNPGIKATRADLEVALRDLDAVCDAADVPAAELPEPAFRMKWCGIRAAYVVDRPNIGNTDVYTADQMRAAMARAAVPDVDAMVNRFLAWPLPSDFGPDAGISFTPCPHPNGWPVGTNLLTAVQAKAMFLHCLAAPAKTAAEFPSGWRVTRPTSPQSEHDRWEVYNPHGIGGVVSTHDVKDWAVRDLLDVLAESAKAGA